MTTLNVDLICQRVNFIHRLLIRARDLQDGPAKMHYIHGSCYHILTLPPKEGLVALILLREIAGENLSAATWSTIMGIPSWPDHACEEVIATYRENPGAGLIDNVATLRECAQAICEALADITTLDGCAPAICEALARQAP
jgi:hypothetical protein